MRILYLEDNPDDASLVSRYVETTPHDLVVVSTIEEAWEALKQPISLILIDILITNRRTGYSFARDLRARNLTQPMIAVSALSITYEFRESRAVGFDYFLSKPFEITELAKVIEKYVN